MKKTKQKTRKSAVKRFKITGSGKIVHRQQGFRHLRAKKNKKWLRRLKKMRQLLGSYKKKIRRMIYG